MSWVSCTVNWISVAKVECKFDELAKLRMSSMSWISCTVSWKSWLSCTVSSMSWLS